MMPSKIFQPLLFDTYEYKPTTTTYHDEFKWKKIRTQFKKRVDARRPATAKSVSSTTNINNNNFQASNQNNVNFDLNVKEIALRSKSAAPSKVSNTDYQNVIEYTNVAAQNLASSELEKENVDEQLALLAQRFLKTPSSQQKYSHWLHYPQEETPKYIMDAKKRLGQMHPRTPPAVKKVEAVSLDHHQHINEIINQQNVNLNLDATQKIVNPHVPKHFLQYDSPGTPEHIRDIRRKFRDERYKRDGPKTNKLVYSSMKPEELSKYVSETIKPATAIPVPNVQMSNFSESKPKTPLNRSKSSLGFERSVENSQSEQQIQKIQIPQQVSQQPITIIYNHFQSSPSNQTSINPNTEYLAAIANSIASSNLINDKVEVVDEDTDLNVESTNNLLGEHTESKIENQPPNEGQESLNVEWDRYYGFYKRSSASPSKSPVKGKPPTPTLNELNDQMANRPVTSMSIQSNGRKTPARNTPTRNTPSAASNSNVNLSASKPPVPPENSNKETPVTFDKWLESANEKEKEAVLNMLRTIDGGNQRPFTAKSDKIVVNSPTYGIRTRPPSTKRKLGLTRALHKFPCEICEKILVKQHLWDLSKCPNCGGGRGGERTQSATGFFNIDAENEGYRNITSHFTNSMPTWRGQYIIHPDFTSENRDFKRIYSTTVRPKSSKI